MLPFFITSSFISFSIVSKCNLQNQSSFKQIIVSRVTEEASMGGAVPLLAKDLITLRMNGVSNNNFFMFFL
jgi:hypothetical protein